MQFSITPLGRVLHIQFFNLNHVANVAEYGFIDALSFFWMLKYFLLSLVDVQAIYCTFKSIALF